MDKFQITLFISLFFFALVQTGSSLRCYNCTQVTDSRCADYFYKDVNTITCPSGFLCTKHTQPAITIKVESGAHENRNLTKNVIRSCKPSEYCNQVNSFSQFCQACSTDLCNSSTIIVPSILTVFFAVILLPYRLKL